MADLDALEAEIDQVMTEAEEQAVDTPDSGNLAPCPAPRKTMPENTVPQDNRAADDGQTVRHIESKQKDLKKETVSFDPRRIRQAWLKASSLREFYPDVPLSERDLAGVLIQFSSFIGLGQTTMLKALGILGWEHCILVIDYLSGRTADIAKPEGYLTSMLKNYQAGQPIAAGRVSRSAAPKQAMAV